MRQDFWNWRYVTLVAAVLGVGCAEPLPAEPDLDAEQELPVIGEFYGSFDGNELVLLPYDEALDVDPSLGVRAEALDIIDAGAFGTGQSATGTNFVALEQVSRQTIVNGTPGSTGWDATRCGTPSGGNNGGVCVQIRMRNLFPDLELTRAYAELTSLTPTGLTTSVTVPPLAADVFTATPDFGLTPVSNGLWRYGVVGRNSPVGGGVNGIRWAFHGATTSTTGIQFTFLVRVRGLLVRPTVRATLDQGVLDDPATGYPDRGASEAAVTDGNIGISQDGRFVVFAASASALLDNFAGATGTHIFRKDMQTGDVVLVSRNGAAVPTAACACANPHVSSDGNVVAFECRSCQLTTNGTPTVSQIYSRNITAGTTQLVSLSVTTGFADRAALNPRVAPGGGFVVYNSDATNLASGHPGGRSGCQEVYRHNITARTTRRVSRVRGAPAATFAFLDGSTATASCSGNSVPGREPDVSTDGRYVVFESGLRIDRTEDVQPSDLDVYVYDETATGSGGTVVWRVSRTSTGADPDGLSQNAGISADGSTVAFVSSSTNLIGVTSGREQIYARARAEASFATIEMVSQTPTDTEGGTTAILTPYPALSTTGRFISFWSAYQLEAPYAAGTVLVHTCDRGAPVAALDRCFVTSVAQLSSTGAYTNLGGNGPVRFRIGLGSSGTGDERAFVAYLGKGTGWGGLANAANQVFVSPVGDPRYQMPAGTVP